MGIFLEGEDSRGDHGLGRLVEFRFKTPPGTTSSYITTHTPSGQRKCASWASQPQKSVTLLPCPGGRTTKSTKGQVVVGGKWYLTEIFLDLEIFQEKVAERKNTYFVFNSPPTPRKSRSLWDNVEKYGTARQATDDNVRVHRRDAICMPVI